MLSDWLNERIDALGISQAAAADALNVTQPTVARWCSGQNAPRPEHFGRLAQFFHSDIASVRVAVAAHHGPTVPLADGETIERLLFDVEAERNLTGAEAWRAFGIDKSRYYRMRSGLFIPHLRDIPDLAAALGVDEGRVLWAVYRTELARVAARRD